MFAFGPAAVLVEQVFQCLLFGYVLWLLECIRHDFDARSNLGDLVRSLRTSHNALRECHGSASRRRSRNTCQLFEVRRNRSLHSR